MLASALPLSMRSDIWQFLWLECVNCKISYRSGKKQDNTATIFPEVLKAISNTMVVETVHLVETTIYPDGELETDEEVPRELLEGTALSAQDWRKHE